MAVGEAKISSFGDGHYIWVPVNRETPIGCEKGLSSDVKYALLESSLYGKGAIHTIMTETTHSTEQRIERRRRYKGLAFACLAVGIVGLLVGSYLDQYLVGVLIYWAGFFGMLGVWQFSPVTLYDERDTTIERKASDYTLGVFVLVLGAPGGIALEESGVLTLPAAFNGAMLTLVAVYAVFGVIYTALQRRV